MFRGTSWGDFYDFGDPFPSFWGFGRTRNLPLSLFGGGGPFDDPFFTDPFFNRPSRNFMGSSFFNSNIFGSHRDTFGEPSNFGFIEHQPSQQHRNSGPIIQNILDDDDSSPENSQENEEDPEKISGSGKELHVKDSVDKSDAGAKVLGISSGSQPQTNKYTFHSSTVRYSGINGAYYTSSMTRKMGGDGVMLEESKEADTSSRRATHRVSRGIHDKGHSFSRRLNSDGRVDTMQTLHNLNEDELPGFEEAWRGNAGETLMGWNPVMGMHEPDNTTGVTNHHGRRSSRIIEIE